MYSSLYRSSLISKAIQFANLHLNKCYFSSEARMVNRKSELCLNSVQLLGRVGTNPQQKGSNKLVISFRMATDFTVLRESGKFLKRTQWHTVTCFDRELQEFILNNIKKGQRIYLQGHIEYNEFTDGKGNSKTEAEIIAKDIVQEES